jgi:hypothetical protein
MTTTQQTASGSSLITALEATWATIRRRNPDLPEVVFITGTGLRSASAASVDAKWGHFGAQRWVAGHPQPTATPTTEPSQNGKLHVQADRKPELFVAGECFAEGATHTLTTILHEAAHALAHARQVKDTSRQGKYHNRRYLELAAELGLEWPTDAKAHPVNGFSEVQLTEQARDGYADTIAELDAAITLHLDTFHRLGRAGGRQPGTDPDAGDQDQGDGETGGEGGAKTFNRSKLVCDCYPERSIRVSPKQAERGPILCGICDGEFHPEDNGQ